MAYFLSQAKFYQILMPVFLSLDSLMWITAAFSPLCWMWKWSYGKHFFFFTVWLHLSALLNLLDSFRDLRLHVKTFSSCLLIWTGLLRWVDYIGIGEYTDFSQGSFSSVFKGIRGNSGCFISSLLYITNLVFLPKSFELIIFFIFLWDSRW